MVAGNGLQFILQMQCSQHTYREINGRLRSSGAGLCAAAEVCKVTPTYVRRTQRCGGRYTKGSPESPFRFVGDVRQSDYSSLCTVTVSAECSPISHCTHLHWFLMQAWRR